jgi:peptidyl-prolyl cis-trans isomerase B (cyclophilin B)
MTQPMRVFSISLFGLLLALPAQDDTKKPQEPATKPVTSAAKADATANDPAIKAVDAFIAEQKIEKKGAWKTMLKQPPKLPFDKGSDYFWHLETELGTMKLRYFPDAAPAHVASGIFLARLGFYDGLTFHRVIPGFMAQGGDPLGNGQGGPGYRIPAEFTNGLKHAKIGTLSMARTSDPNSAGSQFFITFGATSQLDNQYTVWGEVVEGIETVKALEGRGNPNRAENGAMKTPIKIVRSMVSVEPKGKPAEPPKEAQKEVPKDGPSKTN